MKMKYILVTGGVISGIGKGIISSSFGAVLKSCGINVTLIKIDPYLNIDAGTFSPYEHGEVFVLDDGGEVDLDFGNYERFLNIILHKDNNITYGKVFADVIKKERRGDYLGKTVQIVPHVTDAIQEWVERVAKKPVTSEGKVPEVCIIELGGTIGDIEGMPFVEAFRQFQFKVKKENFCCVHVSLVPSPKSTGEPKTKPTQASVRELRGYGLSPDMIICRSEQPINFSIKEKISNFCHVTPDQIITIHDLSTIYQVPLMMEEQGIINYLNEKLQLNIQMPLPLDFMSTWRNLAELIDSVKKVVNIALVGKYVKLSDAYASIIKALQHASIKVGYKLNITFIDSVTLESQSKKNNPEQYSNAWKQLHDSNGVIIPGVFGQRGIDGEIEACKWCRENNKPLLGICLGFQTLVIEYAKNVLELADANSTEIDAKTMNPVVIDMFENNKENMGSTMRLGIRSIRFTSSKSKLRTLYENLEVIQERHRHRYEINPKYVDALETAGLKFIGQDDEDKRRMEIVELEKHNYYIGTQFHPEYLSRLQKPSPPFLGLILASIEKLKSDLENRSKLTSTNLNGNN